MLQLRNTTAIQAAKLLIQLFNFEFFIASSSACLLPYSEGCFIIWRHSIAPKLEASNE
jgi:hypothetical protein